MQYFNLLQAWAIEQEISNDIISKISRVRIWLLEVLSLPLVFQPFGANSFGLFPLFPLSSTSASLNFLLCLSFCFPLLYLFIFLTISWLSLSLSHTQSSTNTLSLPPSIPHTHSLSLSQNDQTGELIPLQVDDKKQLVFFSLCERTFLPSFVPFVRFDLKRRRRRRRPKHFWPQKAVVLKMKF